MGCRRSKPKPVVRVVCKGEVVGRANPPRIDKGREVVTCRILCCFLVSRLVSSIDPVLRACVVYVGGSTKDEALEGDKRRSKVKHRIVTLALVVGVGYCNRFFCNNALSVSMGLRRGWERNNTVFSWGN